MTDTDPWKEDVLDCLINNKCDKLTAAKLVHWKIQIEKETRREEQKRILNELLSLREWHMEPKNQMLGLISANTTINAIDTAIAIVRGQDNAVSITTPPPLQESDKTN